MVCHAVFAVVADEESLEDGEFSVADGEAAVVDFDSESGSFGVCFVGGVWELFFVGVFCFVDPLFHGGGEWGEVVFAG